MLKKPKIWTKQDIPTPAEMEEYLDRIRAVKSAFSGISGMPEVPADMDHLTFEEANDMERTLLMVRRTMGTLAKSRVYSGELQAGGF